MLDTPSTESPHGKTLPARSVTFATSWHGSVGRIGAVDLRRAPHRLLLVEPLKRTIIKVRMQWLSIDCLDGSCLKLLFGWLIVRHLPQAGLLSPFLFATNQGNHPIGGLMHGLFSTGWWDQRVHGHGLAYRQKLGVAAGDH